MSRLTERELELIRRERLAAERDAGPEAGTGFLTEQVIDPIRRALQRRRTVAELSRLDDRMLQDIGLSRGSLDAVADAMVSRSAAASRHEGGLLAALRRWRRRQATISRLNALDDRVLQDIGVLRGDIVNIVDRALAAEAAVPASLDSLLQATQVSAPRPRRAQRPLVTDTATLHARAIAEHALQVASRRQAS